MEEKKYSTELLEAFKTWAVGNIYARNDVEAKVNGLSATAFTYNRFIKSMHGLYPLFEHVGRGEYKYLGPNCPYSGPVFHNPSGEIEYQVAIWKEGTLQWLAPSIQSLEEWKKSDYDGIKVLVKGSKGKILYGDKEMYIKLVESPEAKTHDGDYQLLSLKKAFGKALLSIRIGDEFQFGNKVVKLISIA